MSRGRLGPEAGATSSRNLRPTDLRVEPLHAGKMGPTQTVKARLQRRNDDVFDLVEQDRGRPAGSRFALQAVEAIGHEASPPAVHGGLVHSQVSHNLLVRDTLRAPQHDPRPQHEVLGSLGPSRPARQLGTFTPGQNQLRLRPADTALILKPVQSLCGELPTPLAHRLDADTKGPRRTRIRHPISAHEDDPGSFSHTPVRQLRPAHELDTLGLTEHDLHSSRASMHHAKEVATKNSRRRADRASAHGRRYGAPSSGESSMLGGSDYVR